ncbi:hypothetical protein Q4E93_07340 [Flavitalea sp. BT771]|uniref:hypothetical protein n=1 Tax=Flavitalea sp. BT771 TaxID=3063329 RepID=UPI0026E37CED|nr:hypothetical protein [Flavitalea sp. BT771]MDO6430393.1 hypothetical protein [Flavitalea sp. BT771]MDV6219467.1 hypothetical protein [Flavitalea sp. BT771]
MVHLIKFWYAMILLLMSGGCFAQWKISPGFQLVRSSIIDKNFSAAPFSGVVPGASISLTHEGDRCIHALSINYIGGSLPMSNHPEYEVSVKYFDGAYSWLYKLKKAGGAWSGGVGGGLMVLYDSRSYAGIVNNNTSFDFAASLALSGAVAYSLNNIWSLSDQMNIPVVSWMIHPPYGQESGLSSFGGSGNRHQIASFSSYMRLKNALSLNRQVGARGMFSLAYCWDYYRIDDLRAVRQAVHSGGIIYRLTL